MKYKPYLMTTFFAFLTLLLIFSIIRYPQMAFQSALKGMTIWWEVVFPALLPFMIISEIMIGFGMVHFMGVLLEPLMRPLFNVPGTGGFVMAMGFASGYPVGPKLATTLREKKLISRSEGERLVCFTSTADPLFIFGAVAVGFFHNASLGISIALSNYAGAILLGIFLRFYDRKSPTTQYRPDKRVSLLLRALQAMHRARIRDGRPLGKLMGDAVWSSFQTLFIIGGFIILFSVVITFISTGIWVKLFSLPLGILFSLLHIPLQMIHPSIIGFFEVTQSVKVISDVGTGTDLLTKVALASSLIAWGGISVHAQVASIISTTDMRYQPYFFTKIIHAVLTGLITVIIWSPIQSFVVGRQTLAVLSLQTPTGSIVGMLEAIPQIGIPFLLFMLVLLLLTIFPFFYARRKTR
jgi:sporulation integral membrane protein YlbJ